MSSLNEYINESLKKWVWSGFYSKAELHNNLLEILEDEDEEADDVTIELMIDSELANKHAQELSWPTHTDCDRLDAAFLALNQSGICCLGNAGYTMSDGRSDVAEIMASGEGVFREFCFYHQQDIERAIEGDGLMLAFGDADDSVNKSIAIAQDIIGALQKEGLETQWDGSADCRISLPKFLWQRRSCVE